MRAIVASVLIFLVMLVGEIAGHEQKHGEFADESIMVGKDRREYRLIVPESVDLSKPAPIVFAFHGILIDSKDLMPKYTKLADTAEKHGFVLLFPNAIDRSWGLKPEKIERDLAFFDALLKKVEKSYKIDSDRVYVLGMSNGGYFAHLLAKERSRTIAAVASHSGPLGLQTLMGIGATRKFPVMIIHGADDKLFPVSFARENRDKYKREGHEVEYLEVKEQGHMWAAKAKVNEKIWSFFKAHPMK